MGMNFLHFAAVLFVVCVVLLVAGSFTGPAPSMSKVEGLTYGSAGTVASVSPRRGLLMGLSFVLVLCVAAVWLAFRG